MNHSSSLDSEQMGAFFLKTNRSFGRKVPQLKNTLHKWDAHPADLVFGEDNEMLVRTNQSSQKGSVSPRSAST